MKATCYSALAASLLVAAICTNSASAQTTVTAVKLGGDLITGNNNSSLDESGQVVKDFGDFDNDPNATVATDARFTIPIEHDGLFVGTNSPIDPSNSAFWNTGLEIINYGQATDSDGSVGAVFRLNGQGRTEDRLQAGSADSLGLSTGFVWAPHVRKANFLNGANSGETVSFTDDSNGFFWDWNWQNGSAQVPKNTTLSRQTRATVKDGSTWYLSDTVSSSRGNDPNDGISFNPATATWYEWDVDTTLFFDDVSAGVGVLGSTFTDIQSIGVAMMVNADDDTSNNGIVANLDKMNVLLDFTLPPPPTPDTGIGIVAWDMETITPGVSTTDQFTNVFTGDAVIDGTGTPNPGLVAGEMNDPLFLGDVTPGGSLGPIPVSTKPTQTVGGMGFGGGEALSFDGVDDEAIAITGWLADSNETLFIPGLEGVYVEVDFKEVNNSGQGVQNIASGGSVWRLQIDDDGNLEWLTFLEGGGNDTIEVALGTEGDWREVVAFHNADGSKGLFLDGVLVAQSEPGQLHIDRHSILLGNLENTTNYYEGLIDNVFVGGGMPIPGDFDFDGDVDSQDFLVWQRNPALGDLADWEANYGTALSGAVAVVPEPNTACLLFGLLTGLLASRRR